MANVLVYAGGPGGTWIGVNVTVVPLMLTRHGLGGWMEMIARLGSARRPGGPGGT